MARDIEAGLPATMSRCVSLLKVVNRIFFPLRVIEAKHATYFFVEMGHVRLVAVAFTSNGIIAVALLYRLKHVMLISAFELFMASVSCWRES